MICRDYAIARDARAGYWKMIWRGDYEIERKTKAQLEQEKLAEHERIYGKRKA